MLTTAFILLLGALVANGASLDPRCSRYSLGMEAQVLPYLQDCRKFVICDMGGNGQVLPCPTGLYFNPAEHACSYDTSTCRHGELTGTAEEVPSVPSRPQPPKPVIPVQPAPIPVQPPLIVVPNIPGPVLPPQEVVLSEEAASEEVDPQRQVTGWHPVITSAPTTEASVQEQAVVQESKPQSVCHEQPAGKVYPIANDCGLYVVCLGDNDAIVQRCPKGLLYDHKQQRCEFEHMSFCAMPRVEGHVVLDIHGVDMAVLDEERELAAMDDLSYAIPVVPVEENAIATELDVVEVLQEQHQPILIVPEPEESPEVAVEYNFRIIDNHPRCLARDNLALATELPHDTDCSKYLVCVGRVAIEKDCPAGQHWNAKHNWCDFPTAAGCTL